jgi:hypothetical protein
MTEQLITLSTFLIVVSAATERIVALVKSFVPWLAEERKDPSGFIDPVPERRRTLAIQIISLLGAWLTTSLVNQNFNPALELCLNDKELCLPAGVMALLSSGGSAFWSQILGYATAVKDIKKQDRADGRINLVEKANANQRSNSTPNKLAKI